MWKRRRFKGVEEGETIRTDVAFLYFFYILIIFLPLFFFAECDVRELGVL